MKATFPHMGNMNICVKALLNELGMDVVLPPPSSKRTIELGVKYSPEFACLPLKLNLGNFIEAHELGADTIIMGGGSGPCRFGYYAYVQKDILADLGCNYEMIVLEPPSRGMGEILAKIKYLTGNNNWWRIWKAFRFAYEKAKTVDMVEMMALKKRPREAVRGATDRWLQRALEKVDKVALAGDLKGATTEIKKEYSSIGEIKGKRVMKVALSGEVFTVLDPFSNLDLEKKLGYLGVEVDRSIYLSEWVSEHLLGGVLRGVRPPRGAREAACPFLQHFVGGHGQETVGNTVLYAREGFDGLVQVFPFTCMPEIIAESILPVVSNAMDIPVISLIFDEYSGEAGMVTRLEAFVDLLEARKKRSLEEFHGCQDSKKNHGFSGS